MTDYLVFQQSNNTFQKLQKKYILNNLDKKILPAYVLIKVTLNSNSKLLNYNKNCIFNCNKDQSINLGIVKICLSHFIEKSI